MEAAFPTEQNSSSPCSKQQLQWNLRLKQWQLLGTVERIVEDDEPYDFVWKGNASLSYRTCQSNFFNPWWRCLRWTERRPRQVRQTQHKYSYGLTYHPGMPIRGTGFCRTGIRGSGTEDDTPNDRFIRGGNLRVNLQPSYSNSLSLPAFQELS